MEIVKQGERIIVRDGKVATNANCCCKCPPDQKCGPECCKPDEVCCNQQTCCTQEQTCCGGVCCDTVCCNGVCCPPGQVCCGGVCCDPEKCCNGACCQPGEACRYGECSPCNCPETQECCGSTNGEPDVCCDYGQCCGPACCESGETCCTRYDENSQIVSQVCCPTDKCCDGICCEENERCVDGVCQETCGDCVRFSVAPVQLDPSLCNPQTVVTQTISIPPSCPTPAWVTVIGSADDDIAIDGVNIKGTCAFAGGLSYGFLADGDFEISLVDNYGVFYSADVEICFFSEAPPP